ncbi:PQQ-dependent sugar dehydrogenase [Marinimicrobium agarilyticum]|uniref:PQQ-dependent sugar dehydrogenase n=1 Tax=Marinimicrobium agarilyticum TaxID=306546 RepID=UPI0006884FC4|nr:PQQ-dependent sugar dehydrogenase [Marinimicrobium agarilyticum]
MSLERAFPGVSFNQPVAMLQAPGDDSRWFVVEQPGRIQMFANDPAVSSTNVFADLRERVDDSAAESGLLSMAFHPDFAENGEVFLYYQVSEDTTPPIEDDCCVSQLVRYQTNADGTALDADSAEVLLRYTAPYRSKNHFGGRLGFDDDGYLYLSIGDGGGAGDPDNRAQNTANLWGSLIRIDVDSGSPYGIPADNPFADQSAFLCDSDTQMQQKQAAGGDCPELYAWGLRNPWRWAFDSDTGVLWLADVGQGAWEEVNRIERGGNYGWDIREGAHCYSASNCDTSGLIDPVAEVPQPDFRSITGGVVYRGSAIASLQGKYLFGDYVTGRFYALADSDPEQAGLEIEVLDDSTGLGIASFAQGPAGEVYLVDYGGGVHRVVANDPENETGGPPAQLSDTGCVNPDAPWEPAEGLIPYRVNAPFWSDGADKRRWLALPNDQTIAIDETGDWQLPPGSVVMKNFYRQEVLIETRLFMHHTDGRWAGYTYAWNDDGTDAQRVHGGRVETRQGQAWIYPTGSECLQCHTAAAGRTLGLETAQLNGTFLYPGTGRRANQLVTLHAIEVLDSEPGTERLPDPYADLQADRLADQARAYLHTNCAQCHRPQGPTNLNMDLRYKTALGAMTICNVAPQNGGSPEERRLLPGDANASVLVTRMSLRNHADQMPPIGSHRVDQEGEALLREWINAMASDRCD